MRVTICYTSADENTLKQKKYGGGQLKHHTQSITKIRPNTFILLISVKFF